MASAIGEAEGGTSAEIRVHLEDHIEEEVVDHAAFIFQELGMHRTRDRNGVLIYVSVSDRLVAVIGDQGINAYVPAGFWERMVAVMKLHFAADRNAEGLCQAVHMVAELLKERFPRLADDVNELPDDVSIGGS